MTFKQWVHDLQTILCCMVVNIPSFICHLFCAWIWEASKHEMRKKDQILKEKLWCFIPLYYWHFILECAYNFEWRKGTLWLRAETISAPKMPQLHCRTPKITFMLYTGLPSPTTILSLFCIIRHCSFGASLAASMVEYYIILKLLINNAITCNFINQ